MCMPRLLSEMHSTDQLLPGSYTYYMGVNPVGEAEVLWVQGVKGTTQLC